MTTTSHLSRLGHNLADPLPQLPRVGPAPGDKQEPWPSSRSGKDPIRSSPAAKLDQRLASMSGHVSAGGGIALHGDGAAGKEEVDHFTHTEHFLR